jgi:hypothetical protein
MTGVSYGEAHVATAKVAQCVVSSYLLHARSAAMHD